MISIVVAIQKKDRGLGFKNELLVKISDDLKRFKELTTGHPIIMGRKTFESIGRPLPNRENIVITRSQDFESEGVVVFHSIEDAIKYATEKDNEIFVIGGGEIYKEALPHTDRLYLSIIDSNKEADTFFPDYSEFTKTVSHEERVDEGSGVKYEYVVLEK